MILNSRYITPPLRVTMDLNDTEENDLEVTNILSIQLKSQKHL